jgi:hypothetical protein
MSRSRALRLARALRAARCAVWATALASSSLASGALHAESARVRASARVAPARSAADNACFDQHELGQELRQGAKLLESRAAFAACASRGCPAAVQRDCERWLTEVAAEVPRVGFRVTFEGKARSDASVSIDGIPQPHELAEPIALEPGLHRYRVSLPAASPFEGELELRAGEPARHIVLALHAPAAKPARRVPTLSWVLGGVGIAGSASFIGFGLSSRSLEQQLEGSCSPLCSDDQINRVRRRSLIANISLGIGLTSLASAGALYFLSQPAEPAAPAEPTLQLGLSPLAGGGALANVELRAF